MVLPRTAFRPVTGVLIAANPDEVHVESRVSDLSAEPVGISAGIDQLPERERDVLTELARAQGGRIGFQALRRRLGLHPQALTRTLRHLETSGFIQRDDLGYGLLRAVPNQDLPA